MVVSGGGDEARVETAVAGVGLCVCAVCEDGEDEGTVVVGDTSGDEVGKRVVNSSSKPVWAGTGASVLLPAGVSAVAEV